MVTSAFDSQFKKTFSKIKNKDLKNKLIKLFQKIIDNPEIGKPMRNVRKGTREVYLPPFRLSYVYIKNENKLIFLDLYHKDRQ